MPVCPLAPTKNALPFISVMAPPISLSVLPPIDPTGSVDAVTPALIHWSLAGTYISAFRVAVVLVICTVRMLPLGSRHQLSSFALPFLVLATVPNLVPASTQVSVSGSQIAVRAPVVALALTAPKSTRPSSSTMEMASPRMKSKSGAGLVIADHVPATGSNSSARLSLSEFVSVSPRMSEYSPPTAYTRPSLSTPVAKYLRWPAIGSAEDHDPLR